MDATKILTDILHHVSLEDNRRVHECTKHWSYKKRFGVIFREENGVTDHIEFPVHGAVLSQVRDRAHWRTRRTLEIGPPRLKLFSHHAIGSGENGYWNIIVDLRDIIDMGLYAE